MRVRVDAEEEGAQLVRFAVRDSGIGIAPDALGRLFQPFAQADGSTTRRYGGTGLGLVISKRLVELMGGQLSLTSAPGVGSTFSFELAVPLALATAEMPRPPAELRGLRVLVAAENESVRALIQRALSMRAPGGSC